MNDCLSDIDIVVKNKINRQWFRVVFTLIDNDISYTVVKIFVEH